MAAHTLPHTHTCLTKAVKCIVFGVLRIAHTEKFWARKRGSAGANINTNETARIPRRQTNQETSTECQLLSSESKAYFDYLNESGGVGGLVGRLKGWSEGQRGEGDRSGSKNSNNRVRRKPKARLSPVRGCVPPDGGGFGGGEPKSKLLKKRSQRQQQHGQHEEHEPQRKKG